MERHIYLNCCIQLNYGYKHLAVKIWQMKKELCNPAADLEDLHANAIIKCINKVDYENIKTIEHCRRIIKQQARDTFNEFYHSFKKQQQLLKGYTQHLQNASYNKTNNPVDVLDMKDVLEYLQRNLKKDQYMLYYERVITCTPFNDLTAYFGGNAATLRKRFSYIEKKVKQLLNTEMAVFIKK
jgi:hypothetical protein